MARGAFAVLVASLAALTFAFGADAAWARDDDRLDLARRIIATRSLESELQFFEATLPYYLQAVEQAVVLTDAERAALPQILQEEYVAALAVAREQSAETYARVFTATELREILAFYESAAGRRFLARQMELGEASIAIQQAMNIAVLQLATERLLEARGAQPF